MTPQCVRFMARQSRIDSRRITRGAKAPLDSVGQYSGDGRGRGRHDDDIGGLPPPG
ncbi:MULTISPECIES: hypothetical protein [Amycolatopsis]|uniref:hypothetical protein n=1 Tax=Amycolatopsis TaxID=1813 RepID=UPI00174ADA9E|nr:hypothetical protein [Amycolatopsis bullii]